MANTPSKLKIAIIGAGSKTFSPLTIKDIMLSDPLNSVPLELALMDLNLGAAQSRVKLASRLADGLKRGVSVYATDSLERAVEGADYVITAVEINRYYYWSQDFHIPRRYGFRQIYGENGGPGGMFHTLRNLTPMLGIARAMERLCPDAWLINYTNPEAKLVEGITRLTKVKTVGLCHGIGMGIEQLARIFELAPEDLDVAACGLNHFSWFQKIASKKTGADLYPELKRRDRQLDWLSEWDEIALSRLLFRTYGLWPLPGANHIGEYIAWSDQYLASARIQYFHDPASGGGDPWKREIWEQAPHKFIYSFSDHPTGRPLYPEPKPPEIPLEDREIDFASLKMSHEIGIPIIEAIAFDRHTEFLSVNMPNKGRIPGIQDEMVVELPAWADGSGLHTRPMDALPAPITEMIRVQGVIHQLVIEAYREQSRNKLLQALLLDPTISTYNNAVALIEEMCERQKDLLPPLRW